MKEDAQLELTHAAAHGSIDGMAAALDAGADLDGVAEHNRHGVRHPVTALSESVSLLQLEATRWLLARGARPSATPAEITSRTPQRTLPSSFDAAPSGDGSLVLVAAGAHVHHVSEDERSTRTVALIEALVSAGDDARTRDANGWTALHRAASAGKDARVAAALLALGLEVDALDRSGWSPLDRARDVGFAEALLDAGAAPDGHAPEEGPLDRFMNGATVSRHEHRLRLTSLVHEGNEAVALARLRRGARATAGAISHAAAAGRDALVAALLRAGADPAERDVELPSISVLGLAVRAGSLASAQALVEAGAPIDGASFFASGGDGQIFGWLAARAERAAIGDALVRSAGAASVAELTALLDAGADVTAVCSLGGRDGWTALHVAASQGAHANVGLLLARGAVDGPGPDGQRAIALARASKAEGAREASTLLAEREPRVEKAPAPVDPFAKGATVRHAKFGAGTVTATDGAPGDTRKLTIAFADATRTLMQRFVQPG